HPTARAIRVSSIRLWPPSPRAYMPSPTASPTAPEVPPLSWRRSSPLSSPCSPRQAAPRPQPSSCERPVQRNANEVLPSKPPLSAAGGGTSFQGTLTRVLHGPEDRSATVRGAPRSLSPTQERA